MNRRLPGLLLCLLAIPLLSSCRAQDTQPEVLNRPRAGGLNVTFLLAADLHFGASTTMATSQADNQPMTLAQVNAHMIDHMNGIGGRQYPAGFGGVVDRPRGLLIAGDLTENGLPGQWDEFVKLYGRDGTDGRLAMPVYESVGNHDCYNPLRPVGRAVVARHGGECYSWEIGDLRIVCLGEPNDESLKFLARDLPKAGRDRPILIYFRFIRLKRTWFHASHKSAA